ECANKAELPMVRDRPDTRLTHSPITLQRTHLTLENIANQLGTRRGDVVDEGGRPILVVGEIVALDPSGPSCRSLLMTSVRKVRT
ncbi:MAG TPA: hypothetical protein VGI78_24900, partial [Acetobacteraceae bacterium]